MEKELIITTITDSITKNNVPYAKVSDNRKNIYTIWDNQIIDLVRQNMGKTLFCDVKESKQGFKNIRAVRLPPTPEKIAKEKESEEIADRVEMPVKNDSRTATMYTSYAKDIFVELISQEHNKGSDSEKDLMSMAIDLVKQARDAFS